jgi:hypothetical protein
MVGLAVTVSAAPLLITFPAMVLAALTVRRENMAGPAGARLPARAGRAVHHLPGLCVIGHSASPGNGDGSRQRRRAATGEQPGHGLLGTRRPDTSAPAQSPRGVMATAVQLRDVIAAPRRALLRAVEQQQSWRALTLIVLALIGAGGTLAAWFAPVRDAALAHTATRLGIAAGSGLVASMLSLLVIAAASGALRLVSPFFAGCLSFAACFRLLACISFPAAVGTVVQPFAARLHGLDLVRLSGHTTIPVTVFQVWSMALLAYGLWLIRITRPGPDAGPASP